MYAGHSEGDALTERMFVRLVAAALAAQPAFTEAEVLDRVLGRIGQNADGARSDGLAANGRVAASGENAGLDRDADGFIDRAEMLYWLAEVGPRERLAVRTPPQGAGDPTRIQLMLVDIGGFARGFPIAVRFDRGETITAYDNGQAPDSFGGDNVFGVLVPKPANPSADLVVVTNNAMWSGTVSIPFATSVMPTAVELYPNGTVGLREVGGRPGRPKAGGKLGTSPSAAPAGANSTPPLANSLPAPKSAEELLAEVWVPWVVGAVVLAGATTVLIRRRARAK